MALCLSVHLFVWSFVCLSTKRVLVGHWLTGSAVLAAAPAVSDRSTAGPVRPVLDILMAAGAYCIGYAVLAAAPAVSDRSTAGPVRPVLYILMAAGAYCIGYAAALACLEMLCAVCQKTGIRLRRSPAMHEQHVRQQIRTRHGDAN